MRGSHASRCVEIDADGGRGLVAGLVKVEVLLVVGCGVKLLESTSGDLRMCLFNDLLNRRGLVNVDCDGAPQQGGDLDRPWSRCT